MWNVERTNTGLKTSEYNVAREEFGVINVLNIIETIPNKHFMLTKLYEKKHFMMKHFMIKHFMVKQFVRNTIYKAN